MIALDLDGTLLRSDNTISDYTVETIKKVQNKGHKVVIATGRPYRMALEHYRRLDILDMQQSIEADFIASEYRKKFYISAQDHNRVNPQLFGVPEITKKMSMDIKKITKNPNGILMQTRHQDKYALAEEMRKHFNYAIEVDSWGGPLNILEFSPKGINKAYALKYLLKILNISQDNLIAFGDEHNDTEMLSFAGTGYAMKNASDTLLPFADKQSEFSNEEDGVAKELEKIFL